MAKKRGTAWGRRKKREGLHFPRRNEVKMKSKPRLQERGEEKRQDRLPGIGLLSGGKKGNQERGRGQRKDRSLPQSHISSGHKKRPA